MSAENAGNSEMRRLWASVKGGGDPFPTPPVGPRLSAVGLLIKEHADERAPVSCSFKNPATERSTPAEVEQDRQMWSETIEISLNAFSPQQNLHLQPSAADRKH